MGQIVDFEYSEHIFQTERALSYQNNSPHLYIQTNEG